MYDYLIHIDHTLFYYVNSACTSTWLDQVAPIIRNKLTWLPLYGLILFLLIKNEGKSSWRWIVLILISVSFSDLISGQFLKLLFHRIRPCQLMDAVNQSRLLVHCSDTFSFPSAHASNHASLAVWFSIIFSRIYKSQRWIISFCFFGWVGAISYAQVYVGVHYPLDTIAGMLVGFTIAIAMYMLAKPKFKL